MNVSSEEPSISPLIKNLETRVRDKILHLIPKPLHKFSVSILIIAIIILIIEFYRAIEYDLKNQRKKDLERAQKNGTKIPLPGLRQDIIDIMEEIEEEKGTKKSKVRNMLESARDGLITGMIAGILTGDHNKMIATGVSMSIVGAIYSGFKPQ